ncbi:hypothetical protein [Nocardioides daphniae]|uniref:hypothetical protein n=1 Tax=Nocardioides daphniae TaxID=402297 RepID=UPI001EE8A395|nr:hypothetical protein [Nocardioides daphniae]
MGYLVRQTLVAALTANALRPSRSFRGGALSFLAGFLTVELAPQILAANSVDTAVHLLRRRRSWPGLALAAFSTAGLAREIALSRSSPQGLNTAVGTLGELEGLEPIAARDAERTLARRVNPLPRRDPRVRVVRDVRYSPPGGEACSTSTCRPILLRLMPRSCSRSTVAGGPSARRRTKGCR